MEPPENITLIKSKSSVVLARLDVLACIWCNIRLCTSSWYGEECGKVIRALIIPRFPTFWNGCTRKHIAYIIHPSAHTSVFSVSTGSMYKSHISGALYICVVDFSITSSACARSTAVANDTCPSTDDPKSHSLMTLPALNTFSSLRSRCVMGGWRVCK